MIKSIDFSNVEITGGFWKRKQDMVRKTSIKAVYDRFCDTGRFDAFKFDWKEGMPNKPHIFWDSDVAKWIEGVAYLTEKKRETGLEKIADNIIEWETTKLQRRLTVLGTLGSITPFIGLFGTVIGVMHAFKDLAGSTAAAGGASVVAAGIAEALINTAAGLFVAIPAVIAYNYFLSKTNYFAKELENIADEIIFQRRG